MNPPLGPARTASQPPWWRRLHAALMPDYNAKATVSYDGKISLCCEDFTAELPLGNITDGLDQLAKNETMKQIRNQFYSGRLDMCRGCNLFRHPRAADVAAARARIEALPADVKRKLVLQA